MFMQLERRTLLWTYHKLGLQGTRSPPLNAWLQDQGINPVQTPNSKQTARSTVPPHQAQLWIQDATHGGGGHIPTPRQGGQEIHSRSMWIIPVLRTWHRRYNPSRTQRPRFATGNTDGKHDETHKIVPGSHGISGRCRTHLQGQQNGPRNPQQHIVLIRTKGPQPRGGTYVYVFRQQHTRK